MPHLSSAKSPQAVMGSLLKQVVGSTAVQGSRTVFHVTVMPCYDKKLEAAREELTLAQTSEPEVDCCLTTSEVLKMLQDHGVSHLSEVLEVDMPPSAIALPGSTSSANLYGLPGGSGGYFDFVFRYAAKVLFGIQVPPGPLPMKQLRNMDLQDVLLSNRMHSPSPSPITTTLMMSLLEQPDAPPGSPPLLRFGLAYGFRNIQTVVRKMRTKKCDFDFVEVMACPSGCLNGGGQIKASEKGIPAAQLLESVESSYQHQDVIPRQPSDNPIVQSVYSQWGCSAYSNEARSLLHTTYRKREKTITASVSDW
eukprot:gene28446-31591_t